GHDRPQRHPRREHPRALRPLAGARTSLIRCAIGFRSMALSNLFKFRDLPEAETSKPFLEHLEDLRWTIVKMAITLLVAMVLCFVFRTTLVQIMHQLLPDVDPKLGAVP